MSTYSNAHAKVKKLIFEVQFPGNWFESDIIGNDFLQSDLFRFSCTDFENPKNPGIQPIHTV